MNDMQELKLTPKQSVSENPFPWNSSVATEQLPDVVYKTGSGALGKLKRRKIENWFKQARSGETQAQYNLGVVYFKGVGVSRNHEEAFKWFEKAAKKGSAKGQGFFSLDV